MFSDIAATPLSRRTFMPTTTAVGGATAAGGLLADASVEAAPVTGVATRGSVNSSSSLAAPPSANTTCAPAS